MLHRIKSMLTDFSGNEGAENAIGCVVVMFFVVFFIVITLFTT